MRLICSAATNKCRRKETCERGNLTITFTAAIYLDAAKKIIVYCLSIFDNDWVMDLQSEQTKKMRVKIIKRKE
jgi:hypothetical protein